MITVDGLVVADYVIEFGVRYQSQGAIPQEFVSPCDSRELATGRAHVLDGNVVQRTVFTTSWEPVFDDENQLEPGTVTA